MTQTVSGSDFKTAVLDSNKAVLVDFYADWCGPCQALAPTLDEALEQIEDQENITIVKINVDEAPEIASEYGVMSIPALKVFKNGEVVQELEESDRSAPKIVEILRSHA